MDLNPRTTGANRPSCGRCGALLARDNSGALCSPCSHAQLVAQAAPLLTRPRDEDRLRRAFASGGVRGVARELGRADAEALELVLAHGLIPVGQRARADTLRALLELADLSHVAAARALGLSRWTVAAYRALLGPGGAAPVGRTRARRVTSRG